MNVMVKNALRLVGTAKNSTKYLRSMWHMDNYCNDSSKNSDKSNNICNYEFEKLQDTNIQAKKELSKYWKNSNADVNKILSTNTAVEILAESLKNDEKALALKVGTFDLSHNCGKFTLKTQENDKTFILPPAVNIKHADELTENLQYEIAAKKKETLTSKIGKFNVSLDDGKLTLKTTENRETFIFNHKLDIEVYKKSSDNLQNEIAIENEASKKNPILPINSIYDISVNKTKLTLKTQDADDTILYEPECNNISQEQWIENGVGPQEINNQSLQIIGHHHMLIEGGQLTIKTKKNDEVFVFRHIIDIQAHKDLIENLKNEIAAEKKNEKTPSKVGKFEAVLECGETTLKTQDNDETFIFKYAVHLIVDIDGAEPIIDVYGYLRSAFINHPDEK